MPRRPVGTRAQALSNTALAAHIASRLAGVRSDRRTRDEWLKRDLGLKLGSNGLDRAAQRVPDAGRPWLLVDEARLPFDLDKTLVVFPGQGRRRPVLLTKLSQLHAARQLIVTRGRRDVLCILIYRHADRDALFAAVEAFGESFVWEDVLEEDRGIEADLWTAMARRIAADELLLDEEPARGLPRGSFS